MEKQSSRANWTIAIASAVIALAFGVFVTVLWRAHFFTFTGTDSSSKVVAEALTLVGGLVAAIVSILGILLKYSLDSQAEDRARIEAKRAAASQKDAENRLKLEAAIQAVQLFGTKDGNETPSIQQTGALFALASLDQHELTIQLASELLQRKKVDASTVASLVDQALRYALKKKDHDPQKDQDLQIDAISLLVSHAADMVTPTGSEVPLILVNWDKRLSQYVREWAPIALGKIMLGRPLPEWREKFPGYANVLIAALALGFSEESEPRLKGDIGAILDCLLKVFPDNGQLFHPRKVIDTKKLREEVSGLVPGSQFAADLIANLTVWVANEAAPQTNPPIAAVPAGPQQRH